MSGAELDKAVVDAIPAMAWSCLPDGTCDFLNQRWCDYTGLSHHQAVGWGWSSTIHPKDHDEVLAKWREILASGEPSEVEARVRRSDGEYRWFLIRAEPFRDKHAKIVRWYGTNIDIDDRKRAEQRLRQS